MPITETVTLKTRVKRAFPGCKFYNYTYGGGIVHIPNGRCWFGLLTQWDVLGNFWPKADSSSSWTTDSHAKAQKLVDKLGDDTNVCVIL